MLPLSVIVLAFISVLKSFIRLAESMILRAKVRMCSVSRCLGGGKKGLQEVGSPEESFDNRLELPRNVLKPA